MIDNLEGGQRHQLVKRWWRNFHFRLLITLWRFRSFIIGAGRHALYKCPIIHCKNPHALLLMFVDILRV
jgi:hypothetical protein